jgi:hypothetical protein
MAEIVQSLFGVSPEMYQQQQEDRASAQAMQFAKLDPIQQANYAIGRGAYGLAGALGGALGGQDPELQRRTVSQQILGTIDPSRPETFDQAVQMALQSGNQQLAYGLRLESEKFKQQALVRADEAQIRADRLLARRQEAEAQRIAQGAYQPGTPERAPMLDVQEREQMADQGTLMPENIAAVAPSFDISRVAPDLMRTAAGRAQLEALTKSQKSLKPETVTVKEGEIIYSVPTTPGVAYTPILSGGEKPTPFTGEMANAALFLYQTNDPAKIFKDFGQEGLNAVSKKAEQDALAKRPVTHINMPNEGERKAAVLSNRLNFSVGQINDATGIDPTAAMPNTSAEVARFLTRSDFIPNKMTSAQRQIVDSAQLDILDAALTLGTGAAYTREQLEGYRKSYFPQLNDKPENLVAKRARLQNILRSAEIASGRAKVPTPIPPSGVNLNAIITAPPSK